MLVRLTREPHAPALNTALREQCNSLGTQGYNAVVPLNQLDQKSLFIGAEWLALALIDNRIQENAHPRW